MISDLGRRDWASSGVREGWHAHWLPNAAIVSSSGLPTFYCPAVVLRTCVAALPDPSAFSPATNTLPEENPNTEVAVAGASGAGLTVHWVPSQCSIDVRVISRTSKQGPQPTAHTLLLETTAIPNSCVCELGCRRRQGLRLSNVLGQPSTASTGRVGSICGWYGNHARRLAEVLRGTVGSSRGLNGNSVD